MSIHRTDPTTASEAASKPDRERVAERMSEHATQIKEDFVAVRDDAAEAAAIARERVRAEAERVGQMARQGGEQAQELHDTVRQTVMRHPTSSVLVTLGVGMLLGRLFAGR